MTSHTYLTVKLHRRLDAVQLIQRRPLRVPVNAGHVSVVVHPGQGLPRVVLKGLQVARVVTGRRVHVRPQRVIVRLGVVVAVVAAVVSASSSSSRVVRIGISARNSARVVRGRGGGGDLRHLKAVAIGVRLGAVLLFDGRLNEMMMKCKR